MDSSKKNRTGNSSVFLETGGKRWLPCVMQQERIGDFGHNWIAILQKKVFLEKCRKQTAFVL